MRPRSGRWAHNSKVADANPAPAAVQKPHRTTGANLLQLSRARDARGFKMRPAQTSVLHVKRVTRILDRATVITSVLHVLRVEWTIVRTKLLELLNDVASGGGDTLTAAEVRERLGLSPQAASNLLARAVRDGLLDRVASGTYVLRPIGLLGTRAASEDVALAVAAKFGDEPHRIVYRSALGHHGLLVHPTRAVQVALPRRVKVTRLSGRRLETFIEPAAIIGIGAEPAGRGAAVSSIERALLECADRPRVAGGWSVLAEALGAASWDPGRLATLAEELAMGPALRRIGSLAEQLGQANAAVLRPPPAQAREVALDPQGEPDDPWLDRRWRVRWPVNAGRARDLVAN